ncbi:MAG: hypothetical protein ACKV22_30345, partial [Bryobacteraceae bacterium]
MPVDSMLRQAFGDRNPRPPAGFGAATAQWRRATFFVARRSRVPAVRPRRATKNVARRHRAVAAPKPAGG